MRDSRIFLDTSLALLLLLISYSEASIFGDRADYRKMNLSSIPAVEIDTERAGSITKLIFSHNSIERLQKIDFDNLQYFPNVRYLFLDNNRIREIDGESFSHLKNLKHLDLSHNELTGIPDELKFEFEKLPSLRYINLKRNPIEEFSNIYRLIDMGIDIDFDGMSGVHRERRLVAGDEEEITKIKDDELMEHDFENKTITDKPRKAFVRDNKRLSTKSVDEKSELDAKFRNSIVFNFVAAGLVLVALPMGMVIYYFVNKNRRMYS